MSTIDRFDCIVPVYKKNNKCEKENYRPVSIHLNFSKIYEKLMYDQLYDYFDDILFPNQCGFRKGYSAQHFLLFINEKFKEAIDRWNEFSALLTDLSKAFDLYKQDITACRILLGISPCGIFMIPSLVTIFPQILKKASSVCCSFATL